MKKQLEIYQRLEISIIPIQLDSKAYDMSALRRRGYRTLADAKRRGVRISDLLSWFGGGTRKKRNCALVTTANLFVLDFDSEDAYWRFVGECPIWASTMTIKSPHGYHCYFRTQEAVPDNVVSIWPDVEIKHSGDCILCPPSRIKYHVYRRIGIVDEPFMLRSILSLPMVEAQDRENFSFFRVPPIDNTVSKAHLYMGVISDIKLRLSVLELARRYTEMIDQAGYHIGCCPAHNDRHPSFRVASGRAVCAVPGCRLYDPRALDQIELHSRLHGLNYHDSIAILAGELGLIQ